MYCFYKAVDVSTERGTVEALSAAVGGRCAMAPKENRAMNSVPAR